MRRLIWWMLGLSQLDERIEVLERAVDGLIEDVTPSEDCIGFIRGEDADIANLEDGMLCNKDRVDGRETGERK